MTAKIAMQFLLDFEAPFSKISKEAFCQLCSSLIKYLSYSSIELNNALFSGGRSSKEVSLFLVLNSETRASGFSAIVVLWKRVI